jgi:hypothetical protein
MMKRLLTYALSTMAAAALFGNGVANAADTVQINLRSILNGRAVSTYSNGKIYTWNKGIDGGGYADGYVTHAVAVHLNYTGHTLPDSARYGATTKHPLMFLNFSNNDSLRGQIHAFSGADSVSINVPQGKYTGIYLALTSAEGSSSISVVLNYTEGPVTSSFTLNDYDVGNAAGVFFVDSAMQKWSNTNNPGDNYAHALNGYGVTADPTKTLTSVKIRKTAPGYLVLWGVTGVGNNITAVEQAVRPAVGSSGVRAVSLGGCGVKFVNVQQGAALDIFSPSGVKIAHVNAANKKEIGWNFRTAANDRSAPGLYLCVVRSGQGCEKIPVMVQ